MNQWGELDEMPVIGKYHVRHTIEAARDTGYMFGKNFDSLYEALEFCKNKGAYPQSRLLIHIKDEEWLRIDGEYLNLKYYVPSVSDLEHSHTKGAK